MRPRDQGIWWLYGIKLLILYPHPSKIDSHSYKTTWLYGHMTLWIEVAQGKSSCCHIFCQKGELWIARLLEYIFEHIFWIVNDLAIKLGRLIDQFMGNIYRRNVCIIWSSGVWIWVLFKNFPTYRNYLKTSYEFVVFYPLDWLQWHNQ